jgi:hypothetical protein
MPEVLHWAMNVVGCRCMSDDAFSHTDGEVESVLPVPAR